jgi:hypothetical protein
MRSTQPREYNRVLLETESSRSGLEIQNYVLGIRRTDHASSLSAKVGSSFTEKWQSVSEYCSLLD